MNTLFVTRWRPDRTDGGAPLRNAQNIAALQAMGQVDVLSIGGAETPTDLPGIRRWRHVEPDRRGFRLPGAGIATPGHHPMVDGHAAPNVTEALKAMLRDGDYAVAVVEEIALCRHIPTLKAAGLAVVFDAHNVEAALRADIGARANVKLPRRLRQALFDRRLAGIERQAVQRSDLVWACSPGDAETLTRLHAPAPPVAVVPNTVDVDAYAAARAAQTRRHDPGDPLRLVFTGTMSYAPNEDASLVLIREVLPALRARGIDATLALVGREPTPALEAAGQGVEGVEITGAVPSIMPWLSEPCIMPMPIRLGSGTRLKALEAFAAGVAVVSTAKGVEGIATRDGHDLLITETPTEMTAALADLWQDPDRRLALTGAAWDTVNDGYSRAAAAAAVHASLRAQLPVKTSS